MEGLMLVAAPRESSAKKSPTFRRTATSISVTL